MFALHDRLQAKLCDAVDTVDRGERYALDGAASTAAWLKDRCGQAGADASRTVQTARKLRSLPVTAAAWREGSLRSGQVRAICDNVSARHIDKFATAEATMVAAFRSCP